MNNLVLPFVFLALFGITFADDLLSREKRQDRHFGGGNNYRPSYGGGNNYRPSRPSYGGGNNYRPSRPSYGGGNNYRPSRPSYGGGNNYRPGNNGGLNFNVDLGNPGRPVNNQLPPHNPAIGALFNALVSNAQNQNGGYYGRPTQSPQFFYQPVGPNGRPAYGYVSDNTQIFVRNKNKQ